MGVVDPDDTAAGKGILLLTNKRLMFLTKSGMFTKYSIHDAFDLQGIDSVSPYKWKSGTIDMFQSKYIRINFGSGSQREFSKAGIHDLVPQMNQAIAARKQETLAEMGSESEAGKAALGIGRPSSVIIEKEVRAVVRVKCEYCGQLNDQLNSKCESCGAPMG